MRLYDEDPFCFHFTARVESCRKESGQWIVTLDRTAFYPEGGGQPADRGRLDGRTLLHVEERNGEIIHCLDGSLPVGATVEGELDRERRRDFMEQHTGQHLVSALAWRDLRAATTAVHLGEETSTIDLAREKIREEELYGLEEAVAAEIAAARPIRVQYYSAASLPRELLRRPPARDFDRYRVLEIADTDRVCCCGTHLSSTAQLGHLILLGVEAHRGGVRLSFLAGGRARRHHRDCWQQLEEIARVVSSPPLAARAGLENLLERNRQLAERVRVLDMALRECRVRELLATAEAGPGFRLVRAQLTPMSAEELSTLACRLAETPDLIVCLAAAAESGGSLLLAFARGEAALDEAALERAFRAALSWVAGRGGGRGNLRRGAGTDLDNAPAALAAAARELGIDGSATS